MKHIAIIVLVLLGSAFGQKTQRHLTLAPLDFRGYFPSMTMDQAQQNYQDRNAKRLYPADWADLGCPEDKSRARECHGMPEAMQARFLDGKLVSASWLLSHRAYPEFRDGLLKKYGAPTSHKIWRYQNGMGASFVGERFQWRRGSIVLVLDEYAASLDD